MLLQLFAQELVWLQGQGAHFLSRIMLPHGILICVGDEGIREVAMSGHQPLVGVGCGGLGAGHDEEEETGEKKGPHTT